MVSSQWAVPCLMWSGGHALSEKDTLGRARHEHRRAVSIWESCRSDSLARDSFTFSTRLQKVKSQKEEGPIGQPRRVKPTLVVGTYMYVRRERIVGGICIIPDVKERLRSIQVEPTSWPIPLHDTQGSCQVDGRAAEGAIIQIPGVDLETWYFSFDPLHNGLEC